MEGPLLYHVIWPINQARLLSKLALSFWRNGMGATCKMQMGAGSQ